MTTIVLDPGHGGSDSGAVRGSFLEKRFNLDIALRVRNYLQNNYDVDVVMTRLTDNATSLSARTSLANRIKADYFCSIHINAGGGTGFESYIYHGNVSNQTVKAQQIIHNEVMRQISRYGVRDRGMKRANFQILRETNMPAILLENLFIDTHSDLNLLRNDRFLTVLSHAIGEGLVKALSLRKKSQSTSSSLYVVIAGSFTSQKNAEGRRNHLRSNGIEAIIVQTKTGSSTLYRVQAGAFRSRNSAQSRLNIIRSLGFNDGFIMAR